MPDKFSQQTPQLNSPAATAFAITPSDGADLADSTRAIYVGVGGDVKVTTVGGDTVTFVGATAGSVLPIRAKKVFATGTTATNLVGMN